jgi:hypothetical protein
MLQRPLCRDPNVRFRRIQRPLPAAPNVGIGSGPGVGLDEPNGRSGVFTRHRKVKVDGLDPANSRHTGLPSNLPASGRSRWPTGVAVAVEARRRHQRREAVEQLKRRQDLRATATEARFRGAQTRCDGRRGPDRRVP